LASVAITTQQLKFTVSKYNKIYGEAEVFQMRKPAEAMKSMTALNSGWVF